MDSTQLAILIAVVAVAVLAVVVALALRAKRRRHDRNEMRDRFGPEYERTVAETGSSKAAVADLRGREEERHDLHLRDLTVAEHDEVRARLATAQYRFAEDPEAALVEVGQTAGAALGYRGYPIDAAREQALRLAAVDHPGAVQPVRRVLEASYDRDVEDMRRTMLGVRDALREMTGATYGPADVEGQVHGHRRAAQDGLAPDGDGQRAIGEPTAPAPDMIQLEDEAEMAHSAPPAPAREEQRLPPPPTAR